MSLRGFQKFRKVIMVASRPVEDTFCRRNLSAFRLNSGNNNSVHFQTKLCRTFSDLQRNDFSKSDQIKNISKHVNRDNLVKPHARNIELDRDESKESDISNELQSETIPSQNWCLPIDYVVKFLKEINALDMCVIQTSSSRAMYVDYFIIVSGRSSRHIKAMASQLVLEAKRLLKPHERNQNICVEGLDCYDWMAVDLGNIAVHFFLPEMRHKLELEKLWTLGTEFDDQYKQMMEDEKFFKAVYTGRNINNLDSEQTT